jgi:hypothetical protein
VKGLRWFVTDLGNHWAARLNVPPDQIVLLDEGLIQRAINIFVHGHGTIDVPAIRRYARAVPRPDVLVHVIMNPEIARRRAVRRPAGLSRRFRPLTDGQLRGAFSDAARVIGLLVTEISQDSERRVTVLTVDANQRECAASQLDVQLRSVLPVAHGAPEPDAAATR